MFLSTVLPFPGSPESRLEPGDPENSTPPQSGSLRDRMLKKHGDESVTSQPHKVQCTSDSGCQGKDFVHNTTMPLVRPLVRRDSVDF